VYERYGQRARDWRLPKAEAAREAQAVTVGTDGFAIAAQPRCPGATRTTSLAAARENTDLLAAADFTQTRTDILDLDPPVVCVLAVSHAPAHGWHGTS
jgi:hypothetical protein